MKTIVLLKARLKSNLMTKSYLRDLKKRGRLWLLPVAGGGITAGIGAAMMMLVQNYKALLTLGEAAGEPELIILAAGIVSSILIFFLSIPLCMSNIFYSRDNILAATLPVTTAEIISSRVISVYLFILPLHLLIVIPAFVIFISAYGYSAAIISSIIFGLTGPAFPIAAAVAAASLLAYAGNKSGYRTALENAGFLIAITIAGGLQILISRTIISGGDLSGAAELVVKFTATLKKIFFASNWTAAGFIPGGWGYMTAGLAFSAVSVLTALLLLRRTKLTLVNNSEKKLSRRVSRLNDPATAVSQSGTSVTKTLLKREWMIIKSCSAFFIETAGEVIIFPIMLAIFYFAIPGELSSMITELTSGFDALPLAVVGALILVGAINSVSSTSISREGAAFTLSKTLPLKGRVQVKAKMIFHLILFLSSWYLNLIIIFLILRLPAIHLLYLIPAGPAVVILEFATSIHIDLSRPVLNWTHPQQAMKQNMNVLVGMGFGLIVAAALIIPAAGLFLIGLNPIIIGIALTAEAAAADCILIPRILDYSDRRYIEIQV